MYFAHILSWIRAQKAHQHGKIILAGFSQGGALTSYLADCFSQLIAGYSMLGAGLQLSSKDHGYAKVGSLSTLVINCFASAFR